MASWIHTPQSLRDSSPKLRGAITAFEYFCLTGTGTLTLTLTLTLTITGIAQLFTMHYALY